MIVITLTKVPNSLRGDLTKWYQEIQTGVYVGNVSAKVRDELWHRIMRDIGNGQATMAYNTNNELGYTFKTSRTDREVVDYEGIPFMMHLNKNDRPIKHGFSDAAKFHKSKVMAHQGRVQKVPMESGHKLQENLIVAIDIETTGLNVTKDKIIAIGAVKTQNTKRSQFYRLTKIDTELPSNITELTGITAELLASEGVSLLDALKELKTFIGDLPLVGYNSHFDANFLSEAFKHTTMSSFSENIVDLMPIVKKENKFIDNYRLNTVLEEYDIKNLHPHNALSDAQATFELATKLMKKQVFRF